MEVERREMERDRRREGLRERGKRGGERRAETLRTSSLQSYKILRLQKQRQPNQVCTERWRDAEPPSSESPLEVGTFSIPISF